MGSHRDLVAWVVARQSALRIHQYADRAWRPARAAVLDQLRRASLSVALNIAEGYASGRGARCRFHLRIAYGSAVETAELIVFLGDLGESVDELLPEAQRVPRLTYALWRSSR